MELLPVDADDEDEETAVALAVVPQSTAQESQAESDQADQPSVEPVALRLGPGQSMSSRYLGLMLFYPALQVVDLLEIRRRSCSQSGVLYLFGMFGIRTLLLIRAELQTRPASGAARRSASAVLIHASDTLAAYLATLSSNSQTRAGHRRNLYV